MVENNDTSIGALRKKRFDFKEWAHKKLPFLFDSHSLFYYGCLIFVLGILWCLYSLITNHFTQFYPWTDYTGQYVTFTYSFWDSWHKFFKTGVLELYTTNTYLGSDNIGSNSYYGLFDPFLIICYIFPRSWIPQTFVIATFAKGVVGAFTMRAYCRYMGVKEQTSRLAGLAYAFNGFLNFMVGFPSVVSICAVVPLVLLGIEKVIKEKKVLTLSFSLALLGVMCFFYLVVLCIFGVIYALWRYFWTIRKRNWKDNLAVLGLGVGSFAAGLMLCAWTLLPSLRESSLSGRTVSIGKAYLDSLLSAIKNMDWGTLFARLFELVGQHPARELQGLIGFFYPTIGYLGLPLAAGANSTGGIQYDAWVASLFTYTPFVVLFWIALMGSTRKKKVSHILAFVFLSYFVFTNFAYYFFYAFTGDGYARWYIVLIPIIIYYGAQELDYIKEEPKWVPFSGALLSLSLAVLTWILCIVVIKGNTFTDYSTTYWASKYNVPVKGALWIVYFQLGMILGVSAMILAIKKWETLVKGLSIVVIAETIIWGNASFGYMGQWNYNRWNGGVAYRDSVTSAFEYIDSFDGDSYYRAFVDKHPEKNAQEVFDYNGTSNFHSLFNYDVNQLSLYIHANRAEYEGTAYGETYYNKSWSAYYGNKRFGTDLALNIKYYGVSKEGYGLWEANNINEDIGKYVNADNVMWGSELVYDEGGSIRVYKNKYAEKLGFGHAVNHIYQANSDPSSTFKDDFYSNTVSVSSYTKEINRNDEVLLNGAVLQDSDVSRFEAEGLSDAYTIEEAPVSSSILASVSYNMTKYTHSGYNFLGPYVINNNGTISISSSSAEGAYLAGPTYFLTDSGVTKSNIVTNYKPDYDTVVLTPTKGTYFNEDEDGAYISLTYNIGSSSTYLTRIFLVGDFYDADGTLHENQMLTYEYGTLSGFKSQCISSAYGSVFGLYPSGKVKYICLNAKSSDFSSTSNVSIPNIQVNVAERSEVEALYDEVTDEGNLLSNVIYSTNKFTFESNFSEKRLVVTSLGYDKGWSVKATLEDGSVQNCNMYKLDGGFVGFVAPAGKASYVMTYETPYLKLGSVLYAVATIGLASYQAGRFIYKIKKRNKEDSA